MNRNLLYRIKKILYGGNPYDKLMVANLKTSYSSDHDFVIPIGTPCLLSKHIFHSDSKIVEVMIKYPFLKYLSFDTTVLIRKENLIPTKNNFPNEHTIISEKDFCSAKRFDDLRLLVDTYGAVTIVFDTIPKGDPLAVVESLVNKFYYKTCVGHSIDSSAEGSTNIFIDIVKIENVIPIIKPNRNNGLFISVYTCDVQENMYNDYVVYKNYINLIVSDYLDNVFVLDGSFIRSINLGIEDKLIFTLRQVFKNILIKNKQKIKQTNKEN